MRSLSCGERHEWNSPIKCWWICLIIFNRFNFSFMWNLSHPLLTIFWKLISCTWTKRQAISILFQTLCWNLSFFGPHPEKYPIWMAAERIMSSRAPTLHTGDQAHSCHYGFVCVARYGICNVDKCQCHVTKLQQQKTQTNWLIHLFAESRTSFAFYYFAIRWEYVKRTSFVFTCKYNNTQHSLVTHGRTHIFEIIIMRLFSITNYKRNIRCTHTHLIERQCDGNITVKLKYLNIVSERCQCCVFELRSVKIDSSILWDDNGRRKCFEFAAFEENVFVRNSDRCLFRFRETSRSFVLILFALSAMWNTSRATA